MKNAEGLLSDGAVQQDIAKAIHSQRGRGHALDAVTLNRFESAFAASFEDVRVHVDSDADRLARSVSARAFTTGTDIFFATSEYAPGTVEGDRLLAHELTHVVQQRNSSQEDHRLTVSHPGEPAEVAADRVSEAVASNTRSSAGPPEIAADGVPGRLQREPADDRSPASGGMSPVSAQGEPSSVASGEWAARRDQMEKIRARATLRQLAGESYAGIVAKALDALKIRLNSAATVHGAAYKDYAKVLAAAAASPKQEEEFTDLGIGTLLAVGMGAGVEAGAPLLGLEAAEGSSLAAKLQGQAGSSAGLKHGGLLERVGTKLEPGGLKPEVLKLKLWTELAGLHAQALKAIQLTTTQSLIAGGAEHALGEVTAVMARDGAGVSIDALNDLVDTIAAADAASQKIDVPLARAQAAIDLLHAKVLAAPEPTGRQLEAEQQIWILWMADLSPGDSSLLDVAAIREYLHGKVGVLGKSSVLGVDFGSGAPEDNKLAAIRAAVAKKKEIETKHEALINSAR